MAQHKASLEKTLQSVFKHKKAGTEVATAVLAVESLAAVFEMAMVEETDLKIVRQIRAGVAHRAFGKMIADAVKTMDAIIEAEELDLVAQDIVLAPGGAPHKATLRPIVIKEISHKKIGTKVSDMVSLVEQAVDALLVEYGVGGASEDEDIEAALQLIKDALAA